MLGHATNRLKMSLVTKLLPNRCFPEPVYCCTGRLLDKRLEALGGCRFAPRADINAEDWPAIQTWLQQAMANLQTLPLEPHELPPGTTL